MLSCADLAVFKAFFNRTKDWADLEEMRSAGTLDVDGVIGVGVGTDPHTRPHNRRTDRQVKMIWPPAASS